MGTLDKIETLIAMAEDIVSSYKIIDNHIKLLTRDGESVSNDLKEHRLTLKSWVEKYRLFEIVEDEQLLELIND